MSEKSDQKLYISKVRIALVFVIMFLILEVIFYLTINYGEVGSLYPLGQSFFVYTPVLVAISVIFMIISMKQTYYEITSKSIIHHRMGKEIEYDYKSILYIDEKYSLKHKQLLFYLNNGKEVFLTFDKKGIIYETVLKNVKGISKEDFHRRFPKVHL